MGISRREPLILLVGDLFFLACSLWLALLVRHGAAPSPQLFSDHFQPFSILFVVWIVVFYIAGLYEKHTTILKSRLPAILAGAQIANSGLAVIFFYFIPFFGITPKTILFIYLFASFTLMLLWRMYGYFALVKSRPNKAVLIGSGEEMKELLEEVNNNPIYNLQFVSSIDLDKVEGEGLWNETVNLIYSEGVSIIAIDLHHEKVEPVLPHLYNLIFSNVSFVDMHKVYEDIFDRVPLSLLKYNWFLENISTQPRGVYDTLKRIMDILIALPLLIVPALTLPFITLAMKIEDGGPIFITQDRVGQNNKLIRLIKFRSMSRNELDPTRTSDNAVTKTGVFIRKTRLDEFPQLWNVLKGDLSLIGPRPELPDAVRHYSEEVPYYNVRHLVRPGLSGWAQLYGEHAHHAVDISMTKNKLSYDLYYIKNRSFILDIKIALKTMRTLASIVGR